MSTYTKIIIFKFVYILTLLFIVAVTIVELFESSTYAFIAIPVLVYLLLLCWLMLIRKPKQILYDIKKRNYKAFCIANI